MLLSTAWKGYEADKRIEGFSPYILKAYGIQANLLIGYFNDPNIDSFDTGRLKEYLATQGKDLKPSSMAHRIRFMKSLFRWCHEEGHLPINPALNFYVKPVSVLWKRRYLNSCFLLAAE